MKNIHLLPTEKPSRLGYLTKKGKEVFNDLRLFEKPMPNILDSENQHIYITSDEEIKEDDYYLGDDNHIYCLVTTVNSNGKKIILTTDQDLIADGVQAIDDEFLEWFIQNPSCESIEVKHFGTCCGNQSITQCINCEKYNPIYKNIIPQEESKQDPTLENAKLALREYILANKEKVTEDLQEMREKSGTGRDETLEEAAKRTYQKGLQDDIDLSFYDGVRLGANYQSERMYSEVFEWLSSKDYLSDKMEFIQKEFEQFKKK
jgi:hypothetical protein